MRLYILFFCLLFSPVLIQGQETTPAATEKPAAAPKAIPHRFTPAPAMKKVVTNENQTNPEANQESAYESTVPPLYLQALAIVALAFSPFLLMLLSPFMKITVVLSLLRTALGVQNSPPNAVINGIAIMMSLFIMYPVATKMFELAKPIMESAKTPESVLSKDTPAYVISVMNATKEPLRTFLQKNSLVAHQRMFYRMIYRQIPEAERADLAPSDFVVLIPSFITGQLKSAFEIGVLIYIPFFVIDMVVSNILLAMGMMMLSPVTISMPLKLFLLVMLDGWSILIEGLVNTFKNT